ncbi:MAG: aminotransferase class V-fold PLP-dependent enzyme [Patescibacteria group bacterium]
MNTKNKESQFLFCPGPVNVDEAVKSAVNNEIGHREPEFSTLLGSINSKILRLFGENPERSSYQPVVVTGSGTAANETVFSSAVGSRTILILSNGEFGERLIEISRLHNPNTMVLQQPWGERLDLAQLEAYLKKNPVDILALVHHETSTGMLNPIKKIGALAKKYKKTYIVDAVSSAGAEKINIADCNISFLTTSASKAIGSLPGVSIVVGKKDEFEKLKGIPPRTIYLNLYKFYKFAKENVQTPNTPAVQSFFALEQALINMLKRSDAHYKHVEYMATFCRSGLKKLGLEFMLEEKDMCSVLTNVRAPEYLDVGALKQELKKRNIVIYDGKGVLKNKVFQVSIIGNLDRKDIAIFLKNLKEILEAFRKRA